VLLVRAIALSNFSSWPLPLLRHFNADRFQVMQSVHDPRDFTIIERYENEGSQTYHKSNPYWKLFDPAVLPMLEEVKGGNVNDGKMDLRRFEELVEGI
jgi:hypothetical protein